MAANATGGVDAGTRDKILDLSTSNRDVMSLVQKKFGGENVSPLAMHEIQYLFAERQQNVSLVSNLVRTLFDTMSNIVSNMRR